jgi:signal peptidase II
MTDDASADVMPASTTESSDAERSHGTRTGIPALTASVAIAVLVIDQLTKRWALSALSRRAPRHVVWTLQWNLTRNSGMAFSQAQGIGPFIGIVAMLVVLWLAWSSRSLTSKLASVAAGLIAGGALGNLVDRIFRGGSLLHGAVIDFVDLQWFPIFNVADMAIDIGGVLFVVYVFLGHRQATPS